MTGITADYSALVELMEQRDSLHVQLGDGHLCPPDINSCPKKGIHDSFRSNADEIVGWFERYRPRYLMMLRAIPLDDSEEA